MRSGNGITDWNRAERLFGKIAFKHLQGATVAVLGCGSGGSKVAFELACCGVGRFILIDPKELGPTNVVRHACGLRYLNWPKVYAVEDLIKDRNPLAEVIAIQGKAEEYLNDLVDVDLVVVAVDSEQVKQALNPKLRRRGLIAIYGGLYEKGIGGDLWVILPKKGACYACIASLLREGVATLHGPKVRDYGQVDTETGTLKGEPGLGISVSYSAAIVAKFALGLLLKGVAESKLRPYPGNALIFSIGESLEIGAKPDGEPDVLTPFSSRLFKIHQREGCLVCGLEGAEEAAPLEELLDE